MEGVRAALASQRRTLWTTLTWVPVGYVIMDKLVHPVIVTGRSMEPTLENRDRLFTTAFWKPKRGDVYVFKGAENRDARVIKRLVALEGDMIRTHDGKWITVPPGHGFFEGDNAEVSRDSNSYGPLPLALITHKPYLHYRWPFMFRLVNNRQVEEERIKENQVAVWQDTIGEWMVVNPHLREASRPP